MVQLRSETVILLGAELAGGAQMWEQHPEAMADLLAPGVVADFPPLKTLENRTTNLPPQPTPLVGRTAERAALANLLRTPGGEEEAS